MNLSRLVLGSEVFSGNWGINYSIQDVKRILALALEHGVHEIDTASSYGDEHFVEKLIGEAICGNRKAFKLSSKFYINQAGSRKGQPITTVSDIDNDLKNTLLSLKTDFLDIYYFHSGLDEFFFQDHIWTYLNNMVKKGIIIKLGLSINHGLVKSGSIEQLLSAKDYGVTIVQTVVNLISRESLDHVIPFCKEQGFGVYGRMPLAKGLLSGYYSKNSVFGGDDPRGKDPIMTQQILEKLTNYEGLINVSYALKWALEHADKIVIGVKTPGQLSGIISAVNN